MKTCIQDVFGLDLGEDTGCVYYFVHGFVQGL
jgi:hypothetical protein